MGVYVIQTKPTATRRKNDAYGLGEKGPGPRRRLHYWCSGPAGFLAQSVSEAPTKRVGGCIG